MQKQNKIELSSHRIIKTGNTSNTHLYQYCFTSCATLNREEQEPRWLTCWLLSCFKTSFNVFWRQSDKVYEYIVTYMYLTSVIYCVIYSTRFMYAA